ELRRKWFAPENLVGGRAIEQSIDASERPFGFHKLIALVAKECPIEIAIELLNINRAFLPGRSGSKHDRMPGHFEQRLSIVIPGCIQHPHGSSLLPIANEVDDILRRRIEIGKDLVPRVRAGTNELV